MAISWKLFFTWPESQAKASDNKWVVANVDVILSQKSDKASVEWDNSHKGV